MGLYHSNWIPLYYMVLPCYVIVEPSLSEESLWTQLADVRPVLVSRMDVDDVRSQVLFVGEVLAALKRKKTIQVMLKSNCKANFVLSRFNNQTTNSNMLVSGLKEYGKWI